jgi:hypothetical protein
MEKRRESSAVKSRIGVGKGVVLALSLGRAWESRMEFDNVEVFVEVGKTLEKEI